MKSLIVYYSNTGNTASTAIILSNILKEKGEVRIVELEAKDEAENFLSKCKRAFFKKRAIIDDVTFDVSSYDLICIGSPVWAFAPTPAIITYLDKIKNLEGKKALAFVTYGSGLGKGRALGYIKEGLRKKGVLIVKDLSISQSKSKDTEFIRDRFKRKEL